MNNNICWCEKCCLERSFSTSLVKQRSNKQRRVTFWGDSPVLLDPPAKSTAYFYKKDSPSKLTIVNLN